MRPRGRHGGDGEGPEIGIGRFEQLWAIFPRKHQRAKARAAYEALAPSQELHADLLASAGAWATHYEKTATDKKWWKHMHTWLVEERYLEDLPEPYENPKEAAIAKARENGPRKAASKTPAKATGLSPKTPIGRHKVKIVGSEMPDDNGSPEQRFKFFYRIEDGGHEGKEFSHTFKYLSEDEDLQAEGQTFFADLRKATGITDPEDTSEFHDVSLLAVVTSMGRIEYASL